MTTPTFPTRTTPCVCAQSDGGNDTTPFGHGVEVWTTNVDGCTCPPYIDADLDYWVPVDDPGRSHVMHRHDVRAHAHALIAAQEWIDAGCPERGAA